MRNIEAFGLGCAFLDYDNDGWQDILLVARPHVLLYHNEGNGQFEDVTKQMGLDQIKGYWNGCSVGDYDGDGYLDILLTGFHRLALLKNDHARRFEDVTLAAGLSPSNDGNWGSSAGFMDLRGHGQLDLVITNYVIFGPHERQYCELRPGIKSGCPPQDYRPDYDEVWENLGNGRFKNVSVSCGIKNTHGYGLVVAFADIDGDGKMDFYIGNDGAPAELMHNEGGMRFKNIDVSSGVGYGEMDHAIAAMGADWADYDRDGRLDLAVTAFSDESYAIFRNLGHNLFENDADSLGVSGPTLKPLGFGAKWVDVDNDGWPDAIFANGHVYDNASQLDPLSTYQQPMMLFHNEHAKEFIDLVPKMGGDMARPIVGRGTASGDFDNDGRVDLLVVDLEGAPLLLHNLTRTSNHWITLDLRGAPPNRFAYGAQVRAWVGKQIWAGQVSPASSYLSSSDPRIHFGLGSARSLDRITIRWSDGRIEKLSHIPGDQIAIIQEGKGVVGHDPTIRKGTKPS
ncbi:MAG TPA: CRTAC1 family protein [Armatimonadota bacterium]|nr:CRTAC1 family protein [Armatimonadota bacterium]